MKEKYEQILKDNDIECSVDDVVNAVEQVGKRHGKEIVYQVNAGQMYKDGYKFFLSVNNVWLTKEVPVKYLDR